MQSLACKNEKNISIIAFIFFITVSTLITILGISPIHKALLEACIYTILLSGIFISIQSIRSIGIRNFAGKSMLFLSISSILILLNSILINFESYFQISGQTLFFINKNIWITESILLSIGLLFLLKTYKLLFPKNIIIKSILFFIFVLFVISLFFGWPQILNSLLITTGLISMIISRKKQHPGIMYISTGLIFLALSNILFIYKTWNNIYLLGEISDISLLISLLMIVGGIHCTKKYYE